MKTTKYMGMFILIFVPLSALSIPLHEGVHWIQYMENKNCDPLNITFYPETLASLKGITSSPIATTFANCTYNDSIDTIITNHVNMELQAYAVQTFFLIGMGFIIYLGLTRKGGSKWPDWL